MGNVRTTPLRTAVSITQHSTEPELDPCYAQALYRWVGEGGSDMAERHQHQDSTSDEPAELTREADARSRADDRSMENIDKNATGEAAAAQSASDAADREAESPADQGGEA